jgi:trehalose-6-phosphatase
MAEKDLGAVLCAGDDETDETMFRLSDARIVSVRVGQPGDTAAGFRIQSPRAFRVFLERFLEETAPSQNPSQTVVP